MSDTSKPRKPTLGKGLDALLGVDSNYGGSDISSNGISHIDPKTIDPNPRQPRRHFESSEIAELSESIKIDGIIQPLIVTKSKRIGRFTLIAGERRLRAAQRVGLVQVPVLIRDSSSEEMLRLALIENIQRSDLNVVEEAQAYASLINEFGLTHEQCALKVGKDRVTVSNILRVLQLPVIIQDDLIHARISLGHGKVLLSLSSPAQMKKARDLIVKKRLNVRQTEQLCKQMTESAPNPIGGEAKNNDLDYLAESLRGFLKTKVKVVGSGTRGKIEVSYFSAAELERVVALINGEVL